MEGIWIDVLGFEGIYKVNNKGEIYSIKNNKILKQYKNKTTGYYMVDLRNKEKRSNKTVHRIVMESFKGYKNMDVNHIDGNKSNNNIGNLEWCTRKENLDHAWNNKLRTKTCNKKVQMLDEEMNVVKTFNSHNEVYKFLGIKKSSRLWSAIKHNIKYKKHYWRLINE